MKCALMPLCQHAPKSLRNVCGYKVKAVLKAKRGQTWYYQCAPNKVASECTFDKCKSVQSQVDHVNTPESGCAAKELISFMLH